MTNHKLPYRLDLKTAPASEPITLAEAKAYLRVTSTDEDTLITNLIISVRQITELISDRRIVTQTWLMFLDH